LIPAYIPFTKLIVAPIVEYVFDDMRPRTVLPTERLTEFALQQHNRSLKVVRDHRLDAVSVDIMYS